jgi:hypothetical protein
MTKYLVLGILLSTVAGTSVRSAPFELPRLAANPVTRIGLVVDGSGASPADAAPAASTPCEHVSFSRNLKYGESDLNVLDVATADTRETSPRPVLLFVAGESFTGRNGGPDIASPLQDEAMCFAARNGLAAGRPAAA